MSALPFRLVSAGDAMVVVEFDERIDAVVNARAVALADALRTAALAGVRDVVPAYRCVAVAFDPLMTRVDQLHERLADLAASVRGTVSAAAAPIDIPVRYGGVAGPDLDAVAAFAGITPDEVVALHTAHTYRVYMLGFAPGFAYMGVVDDRIAMPRRLSPRLGVRRGSVGIAGRQTGVYATDTPGGWQIIGRTDLVPFDAARPEPFLFKPGDSIRFRAVWS